ncbi:MAG: hypothetical protein ACT4NY_07275 [Pseudonocardiales bacterium]
MTAVQGKPSVLNYGGSTWHPPRIYAFIQGENGHFFVRYSDGVTWRWADQGVPPGTTMSGAPSAITYAKGVKGAWLKKQLIYAFIRGANGHLFVNYWDGNVWKWADQGVPPGTTMSGAPAAITYRSFGVDPQQIYVFVRGANGHLFVHHWDGVTWKWIDQGVPPGTTMSGTPAAIAYSDFAESHHIYTFMRGANGRHFIHQRDGGTWKWVNQGLPPENTMNEISSATLRGVTTCGVTSYLDGAKQRRIPIFVSGSPNILVNDVDNGQWGWLDKLDEVDFMPCFGDVVTYLEGKDEEGEEQRIVHAFLTDTVDHGTPFRSLYTIDWNGSRWSLNNRSKVVTSSTPYDISGIPGVTTYTENDKMQRIIAFMTKSDGHLLAYYRTSSDWHWADHGTP